MSSKLPWLPTANTLTLENALHLVPHQRFNFVEWTSGISTQLSDNERVEVTLDDSRKIVSTCQEITTLTTKGRCQIVPSCNGSSAYDRLSRGHRVVEWS